MISFRIAYDGVKTAICPGVSEAIPLIYDLILFVLSSPLLSYFVVTPAPMATGLLSERNGEGYSSLVSTLDLGSASNSAYISGGVRVPDIRRAPAD